MTSHDLPPTKQASTLPLLLVPPLPSLPLEINVRAPCSAGPSHVLARSQPVVKFKHKNYVFVPNDHVDVITFATPLVTLLCTGALSEHFLELGLFALLFGLDRCPDFLEL